jgi:hypothetical protein
MSGSAKQPRDKRREGEYELVGRSKLDMLEVECWMEELGQDAFKYEELQVSRPSGRHCLFIRYVPALITEALAVIDIFFVQA